MTDRKRFINGKCRYCGMDAEHCLCAKPQAGSCTLGCGEGCSCAESHAHGHSTVEWKQFALIGTAAALLIGSFFVSGIMQAALRLTAYLLSGYEVLLHAGRGMIQGRFFDENVLMSIATVGAIILGDYAEAAAVMIFYGVGEGLQEAAVRSSRRRIADAVELRPDHARLIRGGAEAVAKPEDVAVGETILVKVGERVPLDGEVLEGESLLDVSALTGEPRPVRANPGKNVPAGAVNTSGPLTLRVTRPAAESATGRLLRAVEDATKNKPAIERFITRFSRYYTPAVIGAAALVAVLPPLFGAGAWSEWVRRALIFLVISCPCALVLSIPLTFFAGLAITSRQGVLFKGADALERLPKTKAVVLDKTGTLTEGEFVVQRVESASLPEGELLALASAAEQGSLHPVAAAVAKADAGGRRAKNVREIAGMGVSAEVDGKRVLVGSRALLEHEGVKPAYGGSVLVAVDGVNTGAIHVGDRVRESAREAVAAMNRLAGYTAILTGDGEAAALEAGDRLGVSEVFAGLRPEDKLRVMRDVRSRIGNTLFVGDGINDAPVLAGADIGVAIGTGTDMAAEAADALLLSNDLTRLPHAMQTAKKTVRTAKENIAIALVIKSAALALGALGLAGMWVAVTADVGAACICVLHTLTLFRKTKEKD
jgi:Cd2+/Zn2+-exporting ATPase